MESSEGKATKVERALEKALHEAICSQKVVGSSAVSNETGTSDRDTAMYTGSATHFGTRVCLFYTYCTVHVLIVFRS